MVEKDIYNPPLGRKTKLALAGMLVAAFSIRICSEIATDPRNFPDLESRFRIEREIDTDGVQVLSVYRKDRSSIDPFHSDVTALERVILEECGDLGKSTGRPNNIGEVPVNFRLYRSNVYFPICRFVKDKA